MKKSPSSNIVMGVKIKVMAKDMAKSYYTKKVMKKDKKLIVYAPFKKKLNLLNLRSLNLFFKKHKFSSIINCAALNGGTFQIDKNKIDFLSKNSQMAINLVSASKKYGVNNLLNISSSSIYPELKKKLEENDGLKEYLYDKICDVSILKYKSADLGIDDVIYTDEVVGDG